MRKTVCLDNNRGHNQDNSIQHLNFSCNIYTCYSKAFLLVDGLQEFTLMVAYSGMINLLDQLSVFVDEPRLSQHVGRCVFYLRKEYHTDETSELK